MTAWQNKPPLSRRQARDSARLQQGETESEASADASETDAAGLPPIVKSGSGRRVQWDPSIDSAEPLSSRTQARLPEDGSATSEDPTVELDGDAAVESDSEPVTESDSPPTDPAFRVRDFRPERRSSFAPLTPGAAEPWAPPAMSGTPSTDNESADEPNSDEPSDDKPSGGEPEADSPKADGGNRPLPRDLDAPERTMTRRELRMLRARALAEGEPEPSVEFGPEGVNVTTSSITVVPKAERRDAAPSVPDVDAQRRIDDQPDSHDATDSSDSTESDIEPVADDAGVITEEPVIPALIEPNGVDHSTRLDADIVDADIVDADIVDAEIVEEEPTSDAEKLEDTPSSQNARSHSSTDMRRPIVPAGAADFGGTPEGGEHEPEPAAPIISGVVTPAATPFGHWSTQGDNAENAPTGDAALSRNVGVTTGAITTHALVLPSVPESGDQLLAPLNHTGEIMVTGSIDLPRSFGSTGAHPALFDHPDVDALIDEADRDDATAESAPVRAVRAVASNSSARAVIEAPAPRRSRLPLILGIVGGAVLLVGIVVIVTVFVINGV